MTDRSVAYLTGEYPRATDTFIQREVAALRAAGVEVHTLAVRRPGAEHLTGQEQRDGQASTTYLLEAAKGPTLLLAQLRQLTSGPGRYLSGLRLAWATKRPGIKGAVFQLIYFLEAVVLADLMRRRGVSHLHNHFADSSCTVAMLASEVSGVPYSFTLHGSGIFFEAHTWQLGTKVDRAAFVACISHFTRSQAAIFCAAETLPRVHIVHCGVEPKRLSAVRHQGQAEHMVFVGRLVEAKGLTILFQAMAGLVKTRPNLILTVIGDGPDRQRMERAAVAAGLADHVNFVGPKSQTEVAELLAEAQLFVLPSYAEGVPVVAMEALGSGIPVVASFVGGMAEIVEDGVTGYLVRPSDPQQLEARIATLLDDPKLRAAMGDAGRAKVAADFDSTIEASRLQTLFDNSARSLSSDLRPEPANSINPGDPELHRSDLPTGGT